MKKIKYFIVSIVIVSICFLPGFIQADSPQGTKYTLEGPCEVAIENLPGFPIYLPAETSLWINPIMSANVGDLDGDGDVEIVVGRGNGNVYAYSHLGEILPGFPVALGVPAGGAEGITGCPSLADLDNNGDLEIVVANDLGPSSVLMVLDHDGSVYSTWPQGGVPLGYSAPATVALADIDINGVIDIVLGSSTPSQLAALYAFDTSGNLLTGFPRIFSGQVLITSPVLSDVRDGLEREIVFKAMDFKVHLLDYTGEELSGWPIQLNDFRSTSTVGDLDQDGEKEIIVSDMSLLPNKLYVYQPDGTLRPGWPQQLNGPEILKSAPSLADLDADGTLEIIMMSEGNNSSWVYVWHENGQRMNGWPQQISNLLSPGPLYEATVAVGDVDGDGEVELVTASLDTVQNSVKLFVFKTNGDLEVGFPYTLPPPAESVISSPVLRDINGDNKLDIVLSWINFSGIFVGIDAYKINHCRARYPYPPPNPWPQYKYDPAHTGEKP